MATEPDNDEWGRAIRRLERWFASDTFLARVAAWWANVRWPFSRR
jgi:hypothetical protein